jgi:hypothetical protein
MSHRMELRVRLTGHLLCRPLPPAIRLLLVRRVRLLPADHRPDAPREPRLARVRDPAGGAW